MITLTYHIRAGVWKIINLAFQVHESPCVFPANPRWRSPWQFTTMRAMPHGFFVALQTILVPRDRAAYGRRGWAGYANASSSWGRNSGTLFVFTKNVPAKNRLSNLDFIGGP